VSRTFLQNGCCRDLSAEGHLSTGLDSACAYKRVFIFCPHAAHKSDSETMKPVCSCGPHRCSEEELSLSMCVCVCVCYGPLLNASSLSVDLQTFAICEKCMAGMVVHRMGVGYILSLPLEKGKGVKE